MEAVKDLEKDKEKLMESLDTNANPGKFLVPPPMSVSLSSSASSTITTPLFSQPPPPIKSVASQPSTHIRGIPIRASVPDVMHLMPPQYMPVYAPAPNQYSQGPYAQGFTYQEWS